MKQETVMVKDELSASGVSFAVSFDPRRWMTDDPYVRQLTLDQITLLGSHDSGTSVCNWHTVAGTEGRTKTQVFDIAGQLNLGVRYFDIRPYFIPGNREESGLFCGHGSDTAIGWQGALGQSLLEIVNQINEFCKDKKELIILNVSVPFCLKDETFYVSCENASVEDYQVLNRVLNGINYLCEFNANILWGNLNERKTIGDLTAERSAVVIRDCSGILQGNICPANILKTCNEYSNTDIYEKMAEDQFSKMKRNGNEQDQLFILSWTLTQSSNDAFWDNPTVLKLAETANEHLEDIYNEVIDSSVFPNIVYMDKIDNIRGFILAQQINELRVTTNHCRVNIVCDSEKGVTFSEVEGSFNHIITDTELEWLNIREKELKRIIGEAFGKEPDRVYFHRPTPEAGIDLYSYFREQDCSPVQTVLSWITQPQIEIVKSERIRKDQQTITNDGESRKEFEIALSSEIADCIIASDWLDFKPCPSFFERINYISYLTVFPSVNSQGNPLVLKARIPLWGKRRSSLTGVAEARDIVDLEPKQNCCAELWVDKITVRIRIPYKMYFQGKVFSYYETAYKGSYFWKWDINELMKYAGISNEYFFEQEVTIEFYANPTMETVIS